MRQNVKGANQGCFLLMVGIYCFTKGDQQNCMNYYTQAFDVFENLQDELFMLLTCRLIVQCCQYYKFNNQFSKDFESYYDSLLKLPNFRDLRTDLLFENFDKRIELAKIITKGLQDIESTFRDEQYKSGAGQPGELTGVEKVNEENNKLWKQAVRLSLKRSLHSAELIQKNDRDLSNQKKEQLITVTLTLILEHGSNKGHPRSLRRGIQSNYPREAHEGYLHERSHKQSQTQGGQDR